MVQPAAAAFPRGETVPDSAASPVVDTLCKKFAKSAADGLTFLASEKCSLNLSTSLAYWREFAQTYFKALCRQGIPAAEWNSPAAPDESTRNALTQRAPPIRGLEYLTDDVLVSFWSQLDEFTSSKVMARKTGLPGYLRGLHSSWNLVGRVTFHLAENKKNPSLPFAFMATYTPEDQAPEDHSSSTSTVKHRPLSAALRESIDSGDQKKLDALLQPVSKAAKSAPLIAELVETQALFSPQAWNLSLAHRFLKSIPQMESAGVIVRVPDWWNASRPPRPRVEVRVGSQAQSTLSEGGLDLQVNVSIDGEPLTDEELHQLAEARQGLTLLRGKWLQVDQEKLQSALDHWSTLKSEHLDGVGFLEGMRLLSGASIGEAETPDQVDRWTRVQAGPWLEKTLASMRNPEGQITDVCTKQLQATLRPYQSVGARCP